MITVFRCEVSAEAPSFRTKHEEKLMIVVQPPKHNEIRSLYNTFFTSSAGISPSIPLVLVARFQGHRYPLPPNGVGSIYMYIYVYSIVFNCISNYRLYFIYCIITYCKIGHAVLLLLLYSFVLLFDFLPLLQCQCGLFIIHFYDGFNV